MTFLLKKGRIAMYVDEIRFVTVVIAPPELKFRSKTKHGKEIQDDLDHGPMGTSAGFEVVHLFMRESKPHKVMVKLFTFIMY